MATSRVASLWLFIHKRPLALEIIPRPMLCLVTGRKVEVVLAVMSPKASARAGNQPVSAADSAVVSVAEAAETRRRHGHLPRTNHAESTLQLRAM